MAHTTAFESLHNMFGASFSSYHGWKLPADYGDIANESEKLYTDCAAVDLSSFGKIELTGAGEKKLIDVITVNDIKSDSGSWRWGIVCDEKGNLVDLVRVVWLGNVSVILTSPPRREMIVNLLNQTIEKLSIADVRVNDQTEKLVMLGLYGPNAGNVLTKILPFDISDLDVGGAKTVSVLMINATIVRGSWVGGDGYEVLVSAQAASMAGMMIGRYKDSGIVTPAGMECLQAALAGASLPLSVECLAQKRKFNPFNLGLGEFVDSQKDCLAKDALSEIKTAGTKLTAMLVKAAGVKQKHSDINIQYDDANIGWVGLLTYCHKENCGVGVALVDSSYSNLTEEVQLVSDGFVAGAELVELKIKETLDGRV